jgi:(2Fe-2S) ferredoxin
VAAAHLDRRVDAARAAQIADHLQRGGRLPDHGRVDSHFPAPVRA